MRAVRPGHLVVEPPRAIGQGENVQVAQPAVGVRRPGPRDGSQRRQARRVGPRRDSGALLVVLGRAGAPVVVGHDGAAQVADGADPGAPRVPQAGPAVQCGPLPGPLPAVVTGGVVGSHLVRLVRIGQRMARRPELPHPVPVHDHRILDRRLGVARQHNLAAVRVEFGRVGRLDQLNSPVLGARGGAAEVEPPGPLRGAHERRPFQRVGAHEFAADTEQRLEVLAVGGPGDGHGVTAAVADRAAHPVGEVDAVIAERGAGRSRPVTGPASRGLDGHHGSLRLRQQDVSGKPGFPYKHIGIIDIVGSSPGPGGNIR